MRKSSWKMSRRMAAARRALSVGKVDLVYRVVQVGQAMAGEEIRGQRVEDVAGFVEGAVDQGPHPPRLYALVGRVDGHEPARRGRSSPTVAGSSMTSMFLADELYVRSLRCTSPETSTRRPGRAGS